MEIKVFRKTNKGDLIPLEKTDKKHYRLQRNIEYIEQVKSFIDPEDCFWNDFYENPDYQYKNWKRPSKLVVDNTIKLLEISPYKIDGVFPTPNGNITIEFTYESGVEACVEIFEDKYEYNKFDKDYNVIENRYIYITNLK